MRLAAALLLLAVLAPFADARTVDREGIVAPGRFHETNVVVEVPTRLGWSWRAAPDGAEVAFDIHRHEANGFSKVREVKGVANSGSVEAAPGLYSYYWEHVEGSPTPTRVAYTMSGQFRFEDEPAGTGVDAAPPAKESPLPLALALVALAAAARARVR